jgi:hypothetical protein
MYLAAQGDKVLFLLLLKSLAQSPEQQRSSGGVEGMMVSFPRCSSVPLPKEKNAGEIIVHMHYMV